MEVTLLSRSRKIKQKVEQDLSWYDSGTRTTFREKGGRLDFYYDPQKKRMLPKAVEHYELVNGNDYPLLKEWVKKFQNVFNFEVIADTKKNIMIEISAHSMESLASNLKRNDILFDYDDREYKKELKHAF